MEPSLWDGSNGGSQNVFMEKYGSFSLNYPCYPFLFGALYKSENDFSKALHWQEVDPVNELVVPAGQSIHLSRLLVVDLNVPLGHFVHNGLFNSVPGPHISEERQEEDNVRKGI